MSSAAAAPAGLVGAGCAGYAEQVPTGPGSVAGLAMDPVATAAGNSPVLTTLAGALSGKLNPNVNLVETLNNGEFTVFAPTDEAFAKVDPATIEKLKTDSDLLTSVLTYHVVSGPGADAKAVIGDHTTVQGESLTVTGSGDAISVNDAGVVAILDGRLRRRTYGQAFLKALPPMTRVGSQKTVAQFWVRFVEPALGLAQPKRPS
jgi:uncharacterized surface protein with fasciclin (FAS1) repeats